jgi:hypothetical protein
MGVVLEVAIGSIFLMSLMVYVERKNTDKVFLNIIQGALTIGFVLFAYIIGHFILNLFLS